MNCCQMNEPEGETASGVLGQCGLLGQGPGLLHSQTPAPKRVLAFTEGLGDAGLYPAQVCHECHDKPSDTRRGSHRLLCGPGFVTPHPSPSGDDTGQH